MLYDWHKKCQSHGRTNGAAIPQRVSDPNCGYNLWYDMNVYVIKNSWKEVEYLHNLKKSFGGN